MPKVESEDVVRIHIWMYRRDVEKIHRLYDRRIGFSRAIRMMVRKFLLQLEAHTPQPTIVIDAEAEQLILEELDEDE